jgi:hypothetical protein
MTNVLGSPAPSEHRTPPDSGESLGGDYSGKIINMVTKGLPKAPNSVAGTTRFHASDLPSGVTMPSQGPYHEITASVGQMGDESLPRLTGLSMMWGNREAAPDPDGITRLRTNVDLIPASDGTLRRIVKQEIREPGAIDTKVLREESQVDQTNIGEVAAQIEEHGIRPFQPPDHAP